MSKKWKIYQFKVTQLTKFLVNRPREFFTENGIFESFAWIIQIFQLSRPNFVQNNQIFSNSTTDFERSNKMVWLDQIYIFSEYSSWKNLKLVNNSITHDSVYIYNIICYDISQNHHWLNQLLTFHFIISHFLQFQLQGEFIDPK